jgi:hypothetical protein
MPLRLVTPAARIEAITGRTCSAKRCASRIETSRPGRSRIRRIGRIAEPRAALPARGEGGPLRFDALQGCISSARERLCFVAFDLLHVDGVDYFEAARLETMPSPPMAATCSNSFSPSPRRSG